MVTYRRSITVTSIPDNIKAAFTRHFAAMGKTIAETDMRHYMREMVIDNPQFPDSDDVADILISFFEAVRYGGADLKGANIMAHTRALNAFLAERKAMKVHVPIPTSGAPQEKPNHWRYDKDAPLPAHITKDKAYELLHILKDVYGSDIQRILRSPNWNHYIDKLKARYHNLA